MYTTQKLLDSQGSGGVPWAEREAEKEEGLEQACCEAGLQIQEYKDAIKYVPIIPTPNMIKGGPWLIFELWLIKSIQTVTK